MHSIASSKQLQEDSNPRDDFMDMANQGTQLGPQFHRAAKHNTLLIVKCLPCEKQDYHQPNFLVIFSTSKQPLNTSTSNMQPNGNLVW